MKKLLSTIMLLGAFSFLIIPVHAQEKVESKIEIQFNEELAGLKPLPGRTSTYEVTGTDVNLRTGPGLSYARVRKLQKGEYVSGGRIFEDADGYTWTAVQCQKDGKHGWVAINYINEI